MVSLFLFSTITWILPFETSPSNLKVYSRLSLNFITFFTYPLQDEKETSHLFFPLSEPTNNKARFEVNPED